MQFHDVLVGDEMVWPNLLSIEHVLAPHARELEALGDVLVDEACNVVHRVAAPYRERLVVVGLFTRRLRVDTHDLERLEQERSDLVEAVAGFRRDGQGGVAQPEQFLEYLDLLGVRVEVTLVGDQNRRQVKAERVVVFFCLLRRIGVQSRPGRSEKDLLFL